MKHLFLSLVVNSVFFCYGSTLDRSSFLYCNVLHAESAMREHLKSLRGKEEYALAYKAYAETFAPHLLLSSLSATDPRAPFLMERAIREALEANDIALARKVVEHARMFWGTENALTLFRFERILDEMRLSVPEDMIFWKIPNGVGEERKEVRQKSHFLYTEAICREVNEDMKSELRCKGAVWFVNENRKLHFFDFYPSRSESLFVLMRKDLKHCLLLLRKPNRQPEGKDVQHIYKWHIYIFLLDVDIAPLACLAFDEASGEHDFLKSVEWDVTTSQYRIVFRDFIRNKGWVDIKRNVTIGP